MALKALMLKRKIEEGNAALKGLRSKTEGFQTREAELEASIEEANTAEEKEAVEAEIDKFEAEKDGHEEEVRKLEETIAMQEKELEDLERKAPANAETRKEERQMNVEINIRKLPANVRAMDALPKEARTQIVQKDEVKNFLEEFRTVGKNQRTISGGDLTIPVVLLDLVSENMYRYSKLVNRVKVRKVTGEARQTIAGTVPEAIWTEMCGAINELDFVFNQITVDGFKVAGFIPVCNSLLEDSDIELASAIVEMLSEALGLAKDKAILYGKGASSKMPLGIVTRLAQTVKPDNYSADAPEWIDIHETNIKTLAADLTGTAFWSALMLATGNARTSYSRGEQFWAMNSNTHALLKSKAITFTGSGDVVANVFTNLPIITGNIEILEFMPDGDIVGGYGDLYLWAERAGRRIDVSKEVMFIRDNTVFRGKERADGTPIIANAFVAININGAAVTTTIPFAADTANDAELSNLEIGADALAPGFAPNILSYTLTTAEEASEIIATPTVAGAAVAIAYNGKNVKNGGRIKWETGTSPVTITVKKGNSTRVYTVNVTKSA